MCSTSNPKKKYIYVLLLPREIFPSFHTVHKVLCQILPRQVQKYDAKWSTHQSINQPLQRTHQWAWRAHAPHPVTLRTRDRRLESGGKLKVSKAVYHIPQNWTIKQNKLFLPYFSQRLSKVLSISHSQVKTDSSHLRRWIHFPPIFH